MSNHNHFEDQLPFYVAGLLSGDEQIALEEHIATCLVCQENIDNWQAIASAIQIRASKRVNHLPPLDLEHLPALLPQVNGKYAAHIPEKNAQPISIVSGHTPTSLRSKAIVKPQWLTLSAAIVALIMLGGIISLSYLPQSISLVQED